MQFERDRGVRFGMSNSTRVGLAWGSVLLLVQLLLAAVVVPGLGHLAEHGRRAASDAVIGGVGLIVFGLAMIAVVIGTHRRAQRGAPRS